MFIAEKKVCHEATEEMRVQAPRSRLAGATSKPLPIQLLQNATVHGATKMVRDIYQTHELL